LYYLGFNNEIPLESVWMRLYCLFHPCIYLFYFYRYYL
jgi:hypothetical protein